MTLIIGIVGSPRKDELTSQLVDAALSGAKLSNVEVKKVYLVDFDVKPYVDVRDSCPKELNTLCEEADAINLILFSIERWNLNSLNLLIYLLIFFSLNPSKKSFTKFLIL